MAHEVDYMLDDEQSSPEKLTSEPIKDPYSTDEERHSDSKIRTSCQRTKVNEKDVASPDITNPTTLGLLKKTNSSNMNGVQMHFYFSIQYKPIGEEIDLSDKALEACLVYLFKFAPTKAFDEVNCTWRGLTMEKLREFKVQNTGYFSWLLENDAINWKTASDEQLAIMKMMYARRNMELYLKAHEYSAPAVKFSKKAFGVYEELKNERINDEIPDPNDQKERRHAIMRSFMYAAGTLSAHENFEESGHCVDHFQFYVPHDVASDNSPLIQDGRRVIIKVKADGVFTYTQVAADCEISSDGWLIPIQVLGQPTKSIYKPTTATPGVTTSPSPSPFNPSKTRSDVSSRRDNNFRPKMFEDQLLNSSYIADARRYIESSIPLSCRSCDVIDKMSGEHVMQLLSVASEQFHADKDKNGVIAVLGLCMVNEFIYFSQLEIEKELFPYLQGKAYSAYNTNTRNEYITEAIYRSINSPEVSFSNFRLDITIANHRLALATFLDEYVHFNTTNN